MSLRLGPFRWAVVALFALAVCSLGVAVALAGSGRNTNTSASAAAHGATTWSSWRPSDPGLLGAQEIADYLAPYYRATASNQLAVVTVVHLNNPTSPVQVVVPTNSTGSVLPLPTGSTIVYNLCGEGSSNCSIGVGKPSSNRLLLLRRESLELALYTLRYITGAEWVLTILPPGYTQSSCKSVCAKTHAKPAVKPLDLAVLFDRAELSPWLARPLQSTLPEPIPPTVAQMPKAKEAEIVSLLTSHGMFSESTAQAQDGSTVISLSGPLQPQ